MTSHIHIQPYMLYMEEPGALTVHWKLLQSCIPEPRLMHANYFGGAGQNGLHQPPLYFTLHSVSAQILTFFLAAFQEKKCMHEWGGCFMTSGHFSPKIVCCYSTKPKWKWFLTRSLRQYTYNRKFIVRKCSIDKKYPSWSRLQLIVIVFMSILTHHYHWCERWLQRERAATKGTYSTVKVELRVLFFGGQWQSEKGETFVLKGA